MNFLAHLHLTADDEDLLVGQMTADFLEPGWKERLPPGVIEGVRLHQLVDRYTDSHPLFLRSRRRLAPRFRLYAGIAVDMFYDHFLARHWDRFEPDQSLEEFAAFAYETLERRRADMTDRLRRTLPAIVRYNWLVAYRERSGIARSLAGISRRLTFENPLAETIEALETAEAEFEADFLGFYPELQAYVAANRPR